MEFLDIFFPDATIPSLAVRSVNCHAWKPKEKMDMCTAGVQLAVFGFVQAPLSKLKHAP